MRSSPPHIVSIVGNDITIDSRVKKSAASAAAAGYRSTIVCYTNESTRQETVMGDVTVIKVPVQFVVRNARGRTPNPLRPFVATELARRRLAKRTRQLATKRRRVSRQSDDGLDVGLLLLRVNMKVRQEAYRLRSRAHVVWDRLKRAALKARVRTRNRVFRLANNPADAVFDYEMAFGPVIEDLQPDLIHAHDFHMIGVAMTAARNLRRSGRDTRVIYDAHELVEGLSYEPRVVAAWLKEEEAHIREVDAVIGVSPVQVARLKERYRLPQLPVVTLNAPITDLEARPDSTIREDLGIEGRILVYHGNATAQRGVFVLVEGLAHLPEDVHVAFVLQRDHPLIPELNSLADEIGVRHRLHFVDFVPAAQLPAYLSTADLAVIPYLLTGNHDKTLPNKLFEALQAGLPILASNMEALGGFVEEHQVGRTFQHGSAESLAQEATEILDNVEIYHAGIDDDVRSMSSWDSQARKLAQVYQGLLGGGSRQTLHITGRDIEAAESASPRPTSQKRVAIGPRNMAGQAYMMANAIQTHLGIPAFSFAIEREGIQFPIHKQISTDTWRDSDWQLRQREELQSGFSHVLAESGTGVLGSLNGGFIDEQLSLLKEDGLEVGVIFHGSELRDPRRHAARPYSPYAVDDDLTRRLRQSTARLRTHLEHIDVPAYVTTPDLLQDIDATWLPVVVDINAWSAVSDPFTGSLPTVLHLPSRGRLKGSEHVDPVLKQLDSEGILRYLRPEHHVDPAEVIGLVDQADIVVDGIVIGAYGVMSCQTLAAGRISVANLRELGSLRHECPIIDADPGTLEPALRDLIAHRDGWKEISEAGKGFVSKYHSGSYTADVLRPFLGIDETQ